MARATGAIFLGALKLKPLNYYEQIVRMNGKDDKSPWQIIKELQPKINPAIAKLPALMLDWLGPHYATREELLIRGYDLPCYPSFTDKPQGNKESYRVAGGFFLWLESDRCPGIVNKLNTGLRKRTYKDETFFKQEAGSTIDELWEDYVKEMKEMRDSKKI